MATLQYTSIALILVGCVLFIEPATGKKKFTWKSCSISSDQLVLKRLQISPDPLELPGTLKAGFNLAVKSDITSLQADVKVWKKIFGTWVKLPCQGNVGSCSYNDFCGFLAESGSCPQTLVRNNIPCACPIKRGNYFLPLTNFHLLEKPKVRGDIRFQLKLKK
ncbi:hypothetical protein ScPMuIL_010766 [Solemya velum]